MEHYIIHTEQFEGPLDLLLHLVQKAKVDVMDLSIADITDQYIAYIKSLQAHDLDVASDYILMSAKLIEMKSKLLLPQSKKEDDDELDPRAELIQRLLEYKKYKDVTTDLRLLEQLRQQVYSKPLSDIEAWIQHETILNTEKKKDIYQLVRVFEHMLERQKFSKHQGATLEREVISVDDQINYLSQSIKNNQRLRLSILIQKQSRSYIVTTFLAILQLIRVQEVSVIQLHNFDDIELIGREE